MNDDEYGYSTMNKESVLPVFPLLGFDNSEDLEQDMKYLNQFYPKEVWDVQKAIEEECDQLEYDGSPMYHAHPDRVYFDGISNRIYAKLTNQDGDGVAATHLDYGPPPHRRRHGRYRCPGGYCDDHYDDYYGDNHNPWLRNTINVLLLNELLHRRRRYRSYKRLF